MASLIPNIIKNSVQSPGEILLFNYFKNENNQTKDWKVLHSFDIAQHRKKKKGEADFLILIPQKGILCLEIKAHQKITREKGLWNFSGNIQSETPFEQVRGNSEEIIKQLKEFGAFKNIFVTHLVMFTHCPFSEKSMEWNRWELVDLDEIKRHNNNFAEIFVKHFDASIDHHKNIIGKYNYLNDPKTFDNFNEDFCSQIVNHLRKDIECFVSPSDLTKDLDKELKSFSQEQYRVIDANKDHNLILVDGFAVLNLKFLSASKPNTGMFMSLTASTNKKNQLFFKTSAPFNANKSLCSGLTKPECNDSIFEMIRASVSRLRRIIKILSDSGTIILSLSMARTSKPW